jgi:sugar O-acyltransferase (sialic acid O-acetyltransferase NeuD family)
MAKPKTPILLFGSGGHAKVVADSIEREGLWRIEAVVDPHAKEATWNGLPMLRDTAASPLRRGVIAIGSNFLRAEVARALPGFEFVTVVHPSAQISRSAELGPGTVVFAGACVNPESRIGAHGIVNTRASVDHDCVLGDFSSVAPGATLGGAVQLGEGASVGLGASVIHCIRIGAHTVVGAGATVVADLPELVLAWGVPCRAQRSRRPDEPYL